MDFLELVKERRSIRKYKKDPVSDHIVKNIIEAARFSPSWANTQVCGYIVVKDAKKKEALSETLSKGNPARDAIKEAPLVICIFAKRNVSGYLRGEAVTDKGDWFMFDSGIAMEHIILAAWYYGLGTCHVGAFDAKAAEEILKIPEGYSIVAMTPVGYFDEKPKPTSRKPLSEILFLDFFGNPFIK